jgi:hypothetical protein
MLGAASQRLSGKFMKRSRYLRAHGDARMSSEGTNQKYRSLVDQTLESDISYNLRSRGESACKPGSVLNSHSSGTRVTACLKRPTRKRAGLALWHLRATTSLFGLAPGGVCHAVECCHRRGALLPHRFTLTSAVAGASAVYSLLHCPWARAPQALPGTLAPGARTFLHIPMNAAAVQPTLPGGPYR